MGFEPTVSSEAVGCIWPMRHECTCSGRKGGAISDGSSQRDPKRTRILFATRRRRDNPARSGVDA